MKILTFYSRWLGAAFQNDQIYFKAEIEVVTRKIKKFKLTMVKKQYEEKSIHLLKQEYHMIIR